MELSLEIFQSIRDMLFERTGMHFDDKKHFFIQSRVATRIKATGSENARDYYLMLKYNDPKREEFQNLVEAVTTNETYFFRDYPQLENFTNFALPLIADKRRAENNYTLRIWSAGCSTGDEPYTLAIILKTCLDDFSKWRINIEATDIDMQVLKKAREAMYSERAVKEVPEPYLKRFFVPTLHRYQLVDEIKNMVSFNQVNFMDREQMRLRRSCFDFVFCRNVIIYFDHNTCKQVISSFYNALMPGGILYLGHSESVNRFSAAFETVRMGDRYIYIKPEGKALKAS